MNNLNILFEFISAKKIVVYKQIGFWEKFFID